MAFTLPVVVEVLRDCLRDLRNDGGSVYFAYTKDDDKDGKISDIAIALKQTVREIAVISLQGDGDNYLREWRALKALRDLLNELERRQG